MPPPIYRRYNAMLRFLFLVLWLCVQGASQHTDYQYVSQGIHVGRRSIQQNETVDVVKNELIVWGYPARLPVLNVAMARGGISHGIALTTLGRVNTWGEDYASQRSIPNAVANGTARLVAAGGDVSVAVMANGTVQAWGNDYKNGVISKLSSMNSQDIAAVELGYHHAVLQLANGSIHAVGDDTYQQTDITAGAEGVTAIAAGAYHSLAVAGPMGRVIGFGWNDYNQSSVPVTAEVNITSVAAGYAHSCALKTDGSVTCWGLNDRGQCTVPPTVVNALAIAAANATTLAVLKTGEVIMWGANDIPDPPIATSGAVGLAASTYAVFVIKPVGVQTPLTIPPKPGGNEDIQLFSFGDASRTPLKDVVMVSGGATHALALLANGSVTCWGDNTKGQCNLPKEVQASPVVHVAAGVYMSAAITIDGTCYAWGGNISKDGYDQSSLLFAINGGSLRNVRDFQLGYYHGIALLTDGSVLAFGDNSWGESQVPALAQGAVQVSTSSTYNLAVVGANRSVVAWGDPAYSKTLVPAGLADVVVVVAGYTHAVALQKNGTIVSWGSDDQYQQAIPNMAAKPIAIAAGAGMTMAVLETGEVVTWGFPIFKGYVPSSWGVPTIAQSGAIAVASGFSAGYVFKNMSGGLNNAQLVSWGYPSRTPLQDVVMVSAGSSHALALRSDGSIVCWGSNRYGQCTIPTEVVGGDVVLVGATMFMSVAVLSDGTIHTWGDDYFSKGLGKVLTGGAPLPIKDLKLGCCHAVALLNDGSVLLFGNQPQQQVEIMVNLTLTAVTAVSAGILNTLVIYGDKQQVQASGPQINPFQTPELYGVTDIAASFEVNSALLTNGSISQWGLTSTPPPLPAATDVASGWAFTVDLLKNGSTVVTEPLLYGYALNIPKIASSGVKAVEAGPYAAMAYIDTAPSPAGPKNSTGGSKQTSLVVWGDVAIPPLEDVAMASCGAGHVLVLFRNGSVTCYGNTASGQCSIPPQAQANVLLVAAEGDKSAVVLNSGAVVAWGDDGNGGKLLSSLNNGQLHNIKSLKLGRYHATALLQDGSVLGFGDNGVGQTFVPAALSASEIAVGYAHNIAIVYGTGGVVAWGWNSAIQAVQPSVVGQVVSIAAGYQHSCLLTDSGALSCWGPNGYVSSDAVKAAKAHCSTGQCYIAASGNTSVLYGDGFGAIAWGDTNSVVSSLPGMLMDNSTQVASISLGQSVAVAVVYGGPPSITNSSSSSAARTSVLPPGGVAGVAVGAALLLLAATALTLVWWRRRRARTSIDATALIGMRSPDAHILDAAMDIPGMAKGELFTRTTAFSYQWSSASPEHQQTMVAIEAGITDASLMNSIAGKRSTNVAIQLSKQEIQQQIQLLTHGLLGRGATGLVFKCIWPSRFGPNALLAAKVMRDGFESDPGVLQSFSYEASVLASLEPPHPNVLRLYGYCLEPPTVCLIMELLPCSLKEVLYKGVDVRQGISSTLSSHTGTVSIQMETSTPASQTHQSNSIYLTSSGSEGTSSTGYHTSIALPYGSNMNPASSFKNSRTSTLTVRQVLQISIDIAAGLKYLHETPLAPELAVAAGNAGDLDAVDELEREGSSNLNDLAYFSGGIKPGRKSFKIVHRDLKPANILFNSAGQAKISDFGLARPQQGTTLVTEHIGAGTLPYMAPELLAGSRVGLASAVPASNRVDIYSTAMIMWELLAGCMPWTAMNESALVASVLGGRRPQLPFANDKKDAPLISPSVLQQPPSLDALPEFNAIIRACWQHREQRRPTAEALYDMLTALLGKLESGDSLQV